jgi:hypothetical protein
MPLEQMGRHWRPTREPSGRGRRRLKTVRERGREESETRKAETKKIEMKRATTITSESETSETVETANETTEMTMAETMVETMVETTIEKTDLKNLAARRRAHGPTRSAATAHAAVRRARRSEIVRPGAVPRGSRSSLPRAVAIDDHDDVVGTASAASMARATVDSLAERSVHFRAANAPPHRGVTAVHHRVANAACRRIAIAVTAVRAALDPTAGAGSGDESGGDGRSPCVAGEKSH